MNKFELLNAIKHLEVNETLEVRSNNNFLWGVKRIDIFDNDQLIAVGLWGAKPKLFDFDYCAVSQAYIIDGIIDYMVKEENDFKEKEFNIEECMFD